MSDIILLNIVPEVLLVQGKERKKRLEKNQISLISHGTIVFL
jgi:hypothetical protein